jgi:hypothetical protein
MQVKIFYNKFGKIQWVSKNVLYDVPQLPNDIINFGIILRRNIYILLLYK